MVTEAHRALELLEEYHAKLTSPQDKQLRVAIERVIRIFKSRLFQALLGKHSSIIDPVLCFAVILLCCPLFFLCHTLVPFDRMATVIPLQ